MEEVENEDDSCIDVVWFIELIYHGLYHLWAKYTTSPFYLSNSQVVENCLKHGHVSSVQKLHQIFCLIKDCHLKTSYQLSYCVGPWTLLHTNLPDIKVWEIFFDDIPYTDFPHHLVDSRNYDANKKERLINYILPCTIFYQHFHTFSMLVLCSHP